MTPRQWLETEKIIELMSIPEPNSGCWLWLGAVNGLGYGIINRSKHGEGLAHRLSLKLAGENISGKFACHSCDNPGCVNPAHLFVGDATSNMQDAARKGRTSRTHQGRGENAAPSKLTDQMVLEARRRYSFRSKSDNFTIMAREYGVSPRVMASAVKGETWKHLK